MTLAERRVMVRRHLEAGVRSQWNSVVSNLGCTGKAGLQPHVATAPHLLCHPEPSEVAASDFAESKDPYPYQGPFPRP